MARHGGRAMLRGELQSALRAVIRSAASRSASCREAVFGASRHPRRLAGEAWLLSLRCLSVLACVPHIGLIFFFLLRAVLRCLSCRSSRGRGGGAHPRPAQNQILHTRIMAPKLSALVEGTGALGVQWHASNRHYTHRLRGWHPSVHLPRLCCRVCVEAMAGASWQCLAMRRLTKTGWWQMPREASLWQPWGIPDIHSARFVVNSAVLD